MSYTADQIIADINAYMQNNGGVNADWYVGISEDAAERLFSGHNVTRDGGAWIYRQAISSDVARSVEQAYLDAGCDGGSGGGGPNTAYVYVYRKTGSTRE